MKQTRIYLLRHGQSEANANAVFAGCDEYPLTSLGVLQAECAAKYLESEHIDAFFSSPLSRAIETARPVLAGRGKALEIREGFREIYFGEWEGKYAAYLRDNDPVYLKWRELSAKYKPRSGEGARKAGKRFYDELLSVAREHEGETILIAAHGGVIMALLCEIGYFGYETATHDCIPKNCSITTLVYENSTFSVERFSHNGYLENLKTELISV